MSKNKRVFITGLGALTACGHTAEASWNAIVSGNSGIAPITQWDISSWPCKLGGEIKDFQANRMVFDRKLLKAVSRHDILGINAATQAVEASDVLTYRNDLTSTDDFNDSTGVFVGSPGNKYYQQYDFLNLIAETQGNMQEFAHDLFAQVHPMWLLRILPNNVLAYTGIHYQFKGVNHNITNHAISGAQALIEAHNSIVSDQCERAIAVAYDVGMEPQALLYYQELGVVSETQLRPFDALHDGTILAEGAAAIFLESEACAKKRGAQCYAEILGGFSSTEAAGLFSVDESGSSLEQLFIKTLNSLELAASDIDMIVAHGNGNQQSDESEAKAITKIFPHQPLVTAFKWSLGHTLSASGLLDAVFTAYALKENCVPGIATLTKVAASCNTINVHAQHRTLSTKKPRHALLINRGFSGMNACLVLKSCE